MNVCVFGSSSKATNVKYVEEAKRLGREIAHRGMLLVNGGGRYGVMGGLNDGAEEKNGLVKGIIHQMFCVDGCEHPHVKDMVKVNGSDLWERKQLLLDNGDCIIVMPGGVGTFDELWESVSGKSLGMKGLHGKPICLVNIDGFYDGFILQMQRTFEDGLLYNAIEKYFHVETDAVAALDWCVEARARELKENSVDMERLKSREGVTSSDKSEAAKSTFDSPTFGKAAGGCGSCVCLQHVAVLSAGVLLGFALSRVLGGCRK